MKRFGIKCRSITSILLILFCSFLTYAESLDNTQDLIKGTVTDESGMTLPGVNIIIKGTQSGTQTDFDGNFVIAANEGDILTFSFIGMQTQEVTVGKEKVITLVLKVDAEALEEVVVVSFGKQKKESVVASITTIKPSELKVPSSNLTTALAGRVSGLISYQRSGEPGQDNADFFIRGITSFGAGGNSPLILIDGVELTVQDLARLNTDDIDSFSILKDASATSLYGARGANGVVYVTTKEGVEGPARMSFRAETSFSSSTRDIELADPITYMELFNESIRTRDPLEPLEFTQEKIDNTLSGVNYLLYPTVDWQEQLFDDQAINSRFNFNVNGGGKVARYYISLGLNRDTGLLKVPEINSFNSNIDIKRLQLRSNTNIKISPTTQVKLAFNVAIDDYNGPIQGGSTIYNRSLRTSPVKFLPTYEPDEGTQYADHILFGNAVGPNGSDFYFNPYADVVRGYKEGDTSKILAQVELKQDLKFITKGLSFKGVYNANRGAVYGVSRAYRPFWYEPVQDAITDEIALVNLNPDGGSNNLDFSATESRVSASTYIETSINYAREFSDVHNVTGLVVYTQNNRVVSPKDNDIQSSLPFRNQGIAGRFTYGYASKYFTELNFGYNGSERFAEKERWGFFPSIAVGWILSNEGFLKNSHNINMLKIKASYGLVGNDQIGSAADRFFYLSNVNLTNGSRGYRTGVDLNINTPGVSISRYGNEDITWETAKKLNVGLELKLFNSLTMEADFFREERSNILTNRIVPASLGLQAAVRSNLGEAKSQGIDASLVYTSNFSRDLWLQVRTNFTYAKSEITKVEEPDYTATPWRSKIGQSIGQTYGFVAERLFVDQAEVNNSPTQFGDYTGGDIKYKDLDGNGVINDLDKQPIGNPTSPEIIYGFGLSTGYKNIDFSIFFQGSANSSFFINTSATAPFVSGNVDGSATNNQLLKVWADDHWSEENRNLYAKWPRLSNQLVSNNNRTSTWFIQDGAFLKLKSVELGYTLSESAASKFKLDKFRFYVSGTNLLTMSKFKLWDPELSGNGLGYPTQRVFNIGLNVSL